MLYYLSFIPQIKRIEVDWAGTTILIYDAAQKEVIDKAYLFVGVLPFSQYMYATASLDMKQEAWINHHINVFRYFKGVSLILRCDNLKTGVISHKQYDEIVYNSSYQERACVFIQKAGCFCYDFDVEKKINFKHVALFIFYFSITVFTGAFASIILISKGFSSSSATFIVALGDILSLLIQPIISNYIDNNPEVSVFKTVGLLCVIASVFLIIGIFIDDVKPLTAFVMVMIIGLFFSIEPLINTFSFLFKKQGYKVEYGFARAFGSVGFSIGSAIFAYIDVKGMFLFSLISCLITLLLTLSLDKDYQSGVKQRIDCEPSISYVQFIKNHHSFLLVCLSVMGLFFSLTTIDCHMILLLEKVHGSSSDVGIILSIRAMLELPTTLFFHKIENKFNLKNILKLSGFLIFAQCLSYYLSPSITYIYLFSILQMGGFALLLPGMVSYINKIMSKKQATRGQALFTMTVTAASVISALSAGYIHDSFGSHNLSLLICVIALLSAILLVIFLNLMKDQKYENA